MKFQEYGIPKEHIAYVTSVLMSPGDSWEDPEGKTACCRVGLQEGTFGLGISN